MRPDNRELDDEIRGHLALSVKERIENGENPGAARLAARREFGYGYDMRQVLAIDIPTSATGVSIGDAKVIHFYQETMRRIGALPGVDGAAVGSFVPWRDAGGLGSGVPFTIEGYTFSHGEENPRGRLRTAAPRFFAVLGVPILAGRASFFRY